MSRARHCLAALFLVLAFALLCDAKLFRPGTRFTITENIQIAEAQSWWAGRFDLPERKWDSALYKGKVYSHFPPAFTFLSALVVPVFGGVPHWIIEFIVVLPVLILAYWLSSLLAPTPAWAWLLALGLVCGTSALPVLENVLRGASPYAVNQSLALAGLLLFLIAYLGNGKPWLAIVGVVLAAWSRQMTLAYLIPLGWLMWSSHRVFLPAIEEPEDSSNESRELRLRRDRISYVRRLGMVLLLVLGVPMTLNWLKFGNPVESGYMHVYEGRTDDPFARDARTHGLFSLHYVPRNLYYTNLGFPNLHRIQRGERREWHLTPNDWGTGFWWTTPILFFFVAGVRDAVGDPKRRMLLISSALAYIGLLLYHSTGFEQRGFNRYSLDYVPVLWVMAVPRVMASAKSRWIAAAMIAWSVFYFAGVRHWSQIRIW